MTIYLVTGDGGGKTTNALGIALRSIGHSKNVLMIQFLKWDKNTGEYQAQWITGLHEYLTIRQYGRKGWHGLNNITKEDRQKCLMALKDIHEFCTRDFPLSKIDVLILDEINLAVHLGLLHVSEIKSLIHIIPACTIIMTGRHATPELMELANIVNEIREIKAPKDEFLCEEGIQW